MACRKIEWGGFICLFVLFFVYNEAGAQTIGSAGFYVATNVFILVWLRRKCAVNQPILPFEGPRRAMREFAKSVGKSEKRARHAHYLKPLLVRFSLKITLFKFSILKFKIIQTHLWHLRYISTYMHMYVYGEQCVVYLFFIQCVFYWLNVKKSTIKYICFNIEYKFVFDKEYILVAFLQVDKSFIRKLISLHRFYQENKIYSWWNFVYVFIK